jgi:hypothetical protein
VSGEARRIRLVWSGDPWRGVEFVEADTPAELLLRGLGALSKMMRRSPQRVTLSVRTGDEGEYALIQEPEADFGKLAEWLDEQSENGSRAPSG